jgi:urease accessory protein
MKLRGIVPLAAAALLLAPSNLHAHLVTTGLGPFYDGVSHLALSPDDWLGLLAVALLAGLHGAQASRWTLFLSTGMWLVGAIAGLHVTRVPNVPGVSILSFIAVSLLVALDIKLPAWGVATLGALFGILHGLLNGTSLSQANGGTLNLLGIVVTVFVALLLVSAAVVSLRSAWARVAVRVAGSWVVAVGVLMIGWLFRGAV